MFAETLIEFDLNKKVGEVFKAILIGILVAAGIIGISIVTGGIGGLLVGAGFGASVLSSLTAGTIITGLAVGGFAGVISYTSDSLGSHYFLPAYTLSPEEIFQNKLPIFNVNFFNSSRHNNRYSTTYTENKDVSSKKIGKILEEYTFVRYTHRNESTYIGSFSGWIDTYEWLYNNDKYKLVTTTTSYPGGSALSGASFYINGAKIEEKSNTGSVNEIFNNDAYGFNDANNFKEIDDINHEDIKQFKVNNNTLKWEDENNNKYTLKIENNGKKSLEIKRAYINIGTQLQNVISKWYIVLRNIALVISMSILVYVGIRMMLTSIAAEKAKYKNMLTDWVIGMALLFVMQLIMAFSTMFVELIIDFFDAQSLTYVSTIQVKKGDIPKVQKALETDEYFIKIGGGNEAKIQEDPNGNAILMWPTNLMGVARINAQLNKGTGLAYVGYVLVFLILVFYTIFFIFTYLKRVLYMAFLTIIAPMVAMTYPLDKLSDGKAQAFNMWLKEYIFNLMIQPFHLLLYVVLISSAMDLAKSSILYSLVALGFLMPAEKLLRKFFGFDKAQTPGFLGGAAGAALTMSAVGSLNRFAKGGQHHGGDKSSSEGKINYNRQKLPGNSFDGEFTSNSMQNLSFAEGGQNQDIRMRPGVNNNSSSTDEPSNNAPDNSQNNLPEDLPNNASDNSQNNLSADLPNNAPGNLDGDSENTGNNVSQNATTEDELPKGMGYFRAMSYMTGQSIRKSTARALSNLPSKMIRGGARFVGAGILGGIGAAAGIASGDPNNIIKMGGAGLGTGSAVGAGIANRLGADSLGRFSVEKADTLSRAALGNAEYIKRQNEKLDKEFIENPENRSLYKGKFKSLNLNDEQLTAVMRRSLLYKDKGLTDEKTIMELIKLECKRKGSNGRDYITNENNGILPYVQTIAGQIKDINSPKDIDRVEKGLESNSSLSQSQKDAIIQDLYDIKGFKRVK